MSKEATQYKKGTGGRPKGVKNKTPNDIKLYLQNVLSIHLNNLEQDLQDMTPMDRVNTMIKLLRYVLPAPKTEIELSGKKDMNIIITYADDMINNKPIDTGSR